MIKDVEIIVDGVVLHHEISSLTFDRQQTTPHHGYLCSGVETIEMDSEADLVFKEWEVYQIFIRHGDMHIGGRFACLRKDYGTHGYTFRFEKVSMIDIPEPIPEYKALLGTWDSMQIRISIGGTLLSGFGKRDQVVEYDKEGISFYVQCTSPQAHGFVTGRAYPVVVKHMEDVFFRKTMKFSHYEGSLGSEISEIKIVFVS